MKVVDKWWRPLLKTGTWRVVALSTLAALSYAVTGSLAIATSIALVDLVVKSLLYFLHEYAWSIVKIGRTIEEQKGCVVWITGLSGSGKSTVADRVAEKLREKLVVVSRIDGDVARRTFSSDLGFSSEDRAENCKRAAHAAAYSKESSIVLASFISPYRHVREYVRSLMSHKDVFVVQVKCSIKECASRDPKGMYAKIKDGKFMGQPFTGMHPDAPYEYETNPDLTLFTKHESIDESADKIIGMLKSNGFV